MSDLNEEGLPGLVERDRENLKKMFSSPLDVPREWKAWLRSWLEPEFRSTISGLIPAATSVVYPWTINLEPALYKAVTGTWIFGINASSYKNGWIENGGAQNDSISWDVVLGAGTWTVEILYRKLTNAGIFSVQLDDVEKGVIDMYAAAAAFNQRASATGIVVATSGKVTLKLKLATKHASSGGYFAMLSHVQLRRTA